MKLSIVIVDTNELHFLRPCLDSVFEQTKGFEYEVFVVNNASTDGSAEALAKEYPTVKVVTHPVKRGFAAANNPAILQATGDYVLLLNPDTVVLDNAIGKTVAFMDAHPSVGVAGCKLLYPDNTPQPSVRGFATVLAAFLDATFLHTFMPKDRIIRRKGIERFDYTKTVEVDWVIGAYFMIRRELLQKIGILDEQFWIYGEEVDYCQRALDAGYTTWYVSEASVVHYWRGMTAFSLRVIVWLHYGVKLYVDKHYHGLEKWSIIYLHYLGAAVRVVAYPILACLTFNGKLFSKAYYYAVALYKILTQHWRYDHNHKGEVVPWTEYL
jgi:GT2 family glycosyltransferase